MKISRRFSPDDSVVDLIDEDYNLLPVLSRFSIPLGVGTKTIAEVCGEAGIDTGLFLLVVNYVLSGTIDHEASRRVSPAGIVDFLHKSHEYYLGYKIPHIKANLLAALDENHSDINPIIVSFFDNFVKQVSSHFDYEETTVFPYIMALVEGRHTDYSIDIFRHHHDDVAESLNELKNLILRYYTTSTPSLMYDVLVDIFNCQEDLESHSDIENIVLVPLIDGIEKMTRGGGCDGR